MYEELDFVRFSCMTLSLLQQHLGRSTSVKAKCVAQTIQISACHSSKSSTGHSHRRAVVRRICLVQRLILRKQGRTQITVAPSSCMWYDKHELPDILLNAGLASQMLLGCVEHFRAFDHEFIPFVQLRMRPFCFLLCCECFHTNLLVF